MYNLLVGVKLEGHPKQAELFFRLIIVQKHLLSLSQIV